MKKRVKHSNNRKKADFGATAMLISAAIGAAAQIGTSIYQAEEAKKRQDEINKKNTLIGNETNAQQFANNQAETMKYNQNEELATARTGSLHTLSSAFRCGGKKRMKSGGSVVDNIKKTSRYI